MELSKLLADARFPQAWRGYKPAAVDDVLADARSEVAALEGRLTAAEERATDAQRRLLERSDEDEIRRTLVLAQRTAMAAVEDARSDAARLLSEGQSRAEEAEVEARSRLASLEAEIADRTTNELEPLAQVRSALVADVEALRTYVEEHRARMREEIGRHQNLLDRAGQFDMGPAPSLSDVTRPGTEPPPPAPLVPRESPPAPIEDIDEMDPIDELDDPFMAELRRAATDTEPLGPRDDQREPDDTDEGYGLAHSDELMSSGRFRRRRSRR